MTTKFKTLFLLTMHRKKVSLAIYLRHFAAFLNYHYCTYHSRFWWQLWSTENTSIFFHTTKLFSRWIVSHSLLTVLGPVMTCVIKSSLNWQIVVLHGQMVALQFPDVTPLDSKQVQFWLDCAPQFMVTEIIMIKFP